MKLIIVSGRSGSGKSIILNVLEDLGYYCIDNLPLELLPDLKQKLNKNYKNIAVSIDSRNIGNDEDKLQKIIKNIHTLYNTEIIFLDATNDTLFKRFSETRRKHPLTNKKIGLKEAFIEEQRILQPILDLADLRIDTSLLTVPQLRELINHRLNNQEPHLSLMLQSFGFKYGIPNDTDFIFDVRCIPNPYWEKNLRHLTGLDEPVIEYLHKIPEANKMYEMIKSFVEEWLPAFKAENRRYLTVSIGCTGGQHRSVYFAEKIEKYFEALSGNVSIRHRDLSYQINNKNHCGKPQE